MNCSPKKAWSHQDVAGPQPSLSSLLGSSSMYLEHRVTSSRFVLGLFTFSQSINRSESTMYLQINQLDLSQFMPNLYTDQTKGTVSRDIKDLLQNAAWQLIFESPSWATGSCYFTLSRLNLLALLPRSLVICQDSEAARSTGSSSWQRHKVTQPFRIFPMCSSVIYLINTVIHVIIFLIFKTKNLISVCMCVTCLCYILLLVSTDVCAMPWPY